MVMAMEYKVLIKKDNGDWDIEHPIFSFSINLTDAQAQLYTDYRWDSKTGIVSAEKDGKRHVLPTVGNTIGTIPPGPFKIINAIDINYNYWYY